MSKNNLLKEAIAEAKTIKEVALANAKASLEEAFTPYLKEKLSLKLQEMDNEDEDSIEEVVNETEDVEETVITVEETEEVAEETQNEEFSLDELLAELEENTDETLNENEETVTTEAKKDEEDEELVVGEMSEADLAKFIEATIKDMVEAGDLELEDEATEEAEEEGEIEIEDENDNEGTEPLEEAEEIQEGAWDKIKGVVSGVAKAANMFKQPAEFVKEMNAALKENPSLKDDEQFMSTYNFLKGLSTASKASATTSVNKPMEALAEITKLKKDLNEVNVLNSKLLYVNKIFRANNLNENQKIKVITAFDKANTKKEVELIYETLKGSLAVTKTKEPIKESKIIGSASKMITNSIESSRKSPIVQDDAFARMQELVFGKK